MKPGSFKPLQFLVFMIAMTCFVEPSKAKFCSNSLISTLVQLIPCKPSLSPFSPMPPSLLCCHALKTLGQPCLCAVLDAPPVSGIDYNVAMLLPQKCALNFHPCF
ncbi:putative lipid-transfer protein DIR1 [Cucurbita maxima]|uniref:Lipid-transfer protein DIR1 n=2 Tax=Cucurbita TaxID=3660 RepID=A0A6J1KX32_CUCMA